MGVRIVKMLGVFLAVGIVVALTGDTLPYWVDLAVLVGGVWLMFRIWDAGRGDERDRRED